VCACVLAKLGVLFSLLPLGSSLARDVVWLTGYHLIVFCLQVCFAAHRLVSGCAAL